MTHSETYDKSSVCYQENVEEIDPAALGGKSGDELPAGYFRTPQFIFSYISFGLGFEATFLALTMQSSILFTYIDADIGPDNNIIWVIVCLSLIPSIGFPIFGRLTDIFGRRWFFIVGNALFLVGSIVGSRATNVSVLIGANVISGFGSCTQQLGIVSAVPELVPYKRRYMSVGFCMAFIAPLASVGPALARVLCLYTEQGWRWVYYLLAILSGLAMLLQLFFYFPPEFSLLHKRITKREAAKKLDYIGLFLFSAGATLVLLGINWGGQLYPWKSARVVSVLVAGSLSLIVFGIYEQFCPIGQPLVPAYLFRSLKFVSLVVVASVASMIFFSLNILYPIQVSALFGATGLKAGWMGCALPAGASIGQIAAALFANKIGHTKIQLVTAVVIFTAFSVGLAGVTRSDFGMAIAFVTIASAMVGYIECITMTGAPMMAKDHDIGIAAGITMFCRSFMSSLAVSIYAAIFQGKAKTNLAKYVGGAVISGGLSPETIPQVFAALQTNPATLAEIPGITPTVIGSIVNAALTAYERSFRTVFLVSIAFGVAAIAAALVSSPVDAHLTSEVARKLQHTISKPVIDDGTEKGEISTHVAGQQPTNIL